jgi:7-cyano-7-deazaguanine synthase in queuosine biosynthesis
MLLEELRIEYTPYYIHYYHSLIAVNQDYGDRPNLVKQLTEKIKERLEAKVKEVHAELLKKYMIESESVLHGWIMHYIKDDPKIKRQVEIIDINNERLFASASP